MALRRLIKVDINSKIFKRWSLILCALLVFTIPYENKFSNIALILLGANFIFLAPKNQIKLLLKNYGFGAMLLFVSLFLFGLVWIEPGLLINYYERIGKAILLMVVPILLYPMLNTLNHNSLKFLLVIFGASIIFGLSLNYFAAFFLNSDSESRILYHQFTIGMGGIHPAYLSLFCAFSIFIFLELFWTAVGWKNRLLPLLATVYLFVSMLTISARMPLVALVLGLCVYFFWKLKNTGSIKRGWLISIFFLLSVLIAYMLVDKGQVNLFLDRFFRNVKFSMVTRLETWQCALDIYFNQGNWFFGLGSGNVQSYLNDCYKQNYLTKQYFSHYNAHNEYLSILVRNGISGLASWILVLLYGFYKSISRNNVIGFLFLFLFAISILTEVYLNRIIGVLFFATFYTILIIIGFDGKMKSKVQIVNTPRLEKQKK
ncbi:MAG: O-antigen ligase family protein [Allomuricauda sp.]